MTINWQHLKNHPYICEVYRAKVPGGWLILAHTTTGNSIGNSMSFYPDPEYLWDGSSLPI